MLMTLKYTRKKPSRHLITILNMDFKDELRKFTFCMHMYVYKFEERGVYVYVYACLYVCI